jgi:hypothetical protein
MQADKKEPRVCMRGSYHENLLSTFVSYKTYIFNWSGCDFYEK